MSARRFKSTFLPDRAFHDYIAEKFYASDVTSDFSISIVHSPLVVIPPMSKFRRLLVGFVHSRGFGAFILVIILLNSVFLALSDPAVQNNSTVNSILQVSDPIFLGIFTLELVLKVMCYGGMFHIWSYIRSPWNLLDLVVVVTGMVSLFVTGTGGVSALRVMRVFRPLRTVSKIGSLKNILMKIGLAMPRMRDVFVLLIFVTWLSAIAGCQLFQATLDQKCYYDNWTLYNDSSVAPRWLLMQNESHVCGSWSCAHNGFNAAPIQCGIDLNQYKVVGLSWDNVGESLLIAFKDICKDNWPDDMNDGMDGTSPFAFFFFFVVTFFGGYFCVNLFVAVLTSVFSGEDEDDTVIIDRRIPMSCILGGAIVADAACFSVHHDNELIDGITAMQSAFAAGTGRFALGSWIDDAGRRRRQIVGEQPSSEDEKSDEGVDTDDEEGQARAQAEADAAARDADHHARKPPPTFWDKLEAFFKKRGIPPLRRLVKSRVYNALLLAIIFTNAVVLSMDSRNVDSTISTVIVTTSFYCSIVFIVDVTLKILGLGPSFWVDPSNLFDLVLVLLSIPELIQSNNSAFSALRAFRLIKLLRIAKRWQSLQNLVDSVLGSLKEVASLSFLSLIILYIYAILGYQLFGIDVPGSRFSFGSVFDSLLTVFVILTGENWSNMTQSMIQNFSPFCVIYFVPLVIIGNFFITNLFIAVIIENCSTDGAAEDDGELANEISEQQTSNSDGAIQRIEATRRALNEFRPEEDRVLLDLSSQDDNDDDSDGTGHMDDNEPFGFSFFDVNGGVATDSFARDRRSKNARSAAIVIGDRLDLTSREEIAVVEQFAAEFNMTPNAVDIVGNPAELRRKAEKELVRLEAVRASRRRKDVRMQSLVTDAVSRLKNPTGGPQKIRKELHLTDHRKRAKRVITTVERAALTLEWGGVEHSLMWIIAANNRARQVVCNVLKHYLTQIFLSLVTLASCVSLALNNSHITGGDNTQFSQALDYVDYSIAGLFVLEVLFKWFALGFIGHQGAYFRNPWNILDFVVTGIAVATIFVPAMRPLLAFRALRLTSLNFNMKVVVTALLTAIPGMGSVLVFLGLLWWIYGIFGVALFKGLFYQCNDSGMDRQFCNGTFNNTVTTAIGNQVFLTQREWQSTLPTANFDDIFNALFSMFRMSMSDGWFAMMYAAVDSNGVDNAPSRNSYQAAALYFISFMIIGNFFSINLFTGVLVDRFVDLRQRGEGFHLISENQKQWVMAQKVLLRGQLTIIPEVPTNALRRVCFHMCQHWLFDAFFTFLIIANSVVLSIDYYPSNETYNSSLDKATLVILSFFTLEICMKVVAYNPIVFWRSPWNRLDIFIVSLSWVGVGVGNGVDIIRLFRVARLFLLLRKLKGIQTLFMTLFQSLPELVNVGVVLMVTYFLFAVLGVYLFSDIAPTGPINDYVNFNHVGYALILLYSVTTTEGWADVTQALHVTPPDCSWEANSCGHVYYAVPYMLCFMVIMNLIMMQLLVTVVLGNFLDAEATEGQEQLFTVVEQFRDEWSKHDRTGSKLVHVNTVMRLLPTLPSSIWDKNAPRIRGKSRSVWVHFLRQLEKFYIPVGRDHMVHYNDVMASIAFRLFCVSVEDAIDASQRVAHGVTWRGRALSVHEHFAAIKVTRQVRRFLQSRGERILQAELRELREQHAIMLDVEYEPLRRSHRDTTVLCKWLIEQLAKAHRKVAETTNANSNGGSPASALDGGMAFRSASSGDRPGSSLLDLPPSSNPDHYIRRWQKQTRAKVSPLSPHHRSNKSTQPEPASAPVASHFPANPSTPAPTKATAIAPASSNVAPKPSERSISKPAPAAAVVPTNAQPAVATRRDVDGVPLFADPSAEIAALSRLSTSRPQAAAEWMAPASRSSGGLVDSPHGARVTVTPDDSDEDDEVEMATIPLNRGATVPTSRM